MTDAENPKEDAARWRETAMKTLETAKHLRDREDYRSCVSRAYYAAYQASTSVCVIHGDSANFASGWNNPSHLQLPDMIAQNGLLDGFDRRIKKKHMRDLRSLRESADYKMGATVDSQSVMDALKWASHIFQLLEI